MYVYIYVYMYVYIYICIYVYMYSNKKWPTYQNFKDPKLDVNNRYTALFIYEYMYL